MRSGISFPGVPIPAQEAAERTLEEQQMIELGRRDQEMFVNALLHPAAPNERLRAAVNATGTAKTSVSL
jgi:uncharacterized protein (DUF1778 family)